MKTLKTCLSNKNILSLLDVSSNEILSILGLAEELKKEMKRKNKWSSQVLKGKVLGMLFLKPSTRTRVSFEVGMYQMGETQFIWIRATYSWRVENQLKIQLEHYPYT